MTAAQIALLVASSAGAGVMNAISTVALLPGAAASLYGYRREVAEHRDWLKTLFLPSLLGGALGAVLLLRTPVKTFAGLAPFLILFATFLFMLQGAVARWARGQGAEQSGRTPARLSVAVLFQFGVGVY